MAFFLLPLALAAAGHSDELQSDIIKTSVGDLKMTFVGHGSLMFTIGGKVLHIDPVSSEGDYSTLPKADMILVTHEHYDHLDESLVRKLAGEKTDLVFSQACADQSGMKCIVMKNGDSKTVQDIKIEAVPAYNIVHKRNDGNPFHPKGRGNGYVLTFGDTRVYVAGDTENIPEMAELKDIDIAFIPMNLPYTMDPEMAAAAAKVIGPKILYPYHFGSTDTDRLIQLLKDRKDIEVRIRDLQ
jgi:L-ascorbate metabolism protein UlaG (beta-lactamase superfamily)